MLKHYSVTSSLPNLPCMKWAAFWCLCSTLVLHGFLAFPHCFFRVHFWPRDVWYHSASFTSAAVPMKSVCWGLLSAGWCSLDGQCYINVNFNSLPSFIQQAITTTLSFQFFTLFFLVGVLCLGQVSSLQPRAKGAQAAWEYTGICF